MDFDRHTEKLLSHVVQNHANEAIEILRSRQFDPRILNDVEISRFNLPLYQITVLNSILLRENQWADFFIPVIEKNREQCEILKDFWCSEFHYAMNEEFNFSNYPECSHFRGWNIEDLLEGNLDELVSKGYNRDEAELCYATLVYDIPVLKKHLDLRTNPNVYISADFSPDEVLDVKMDAYNAFEFCNEVIGDIFSCYGFSAFYEDTRPIEVTRNDIVSLIQGAAYYELLEKFRMIVAAKSKV